MQFKITITSVFHCSLERAFKTPMLCDVTKVHTGFGLMPKITGVSDDAGWGTPGGTKKVYAAASATQKGGYISMDKVVERIENVYWKIEVSDFQAWMLGFTKFTGEWATEAVEENKVKIVYTYTLHAKNLLLYPFNFLFAHLFWKKYMRKVLENVRQLAYAQEPYQYP